MLNLNDLLIPQCRLDKLSQAVTTKYNEAFMKKIDGLLESNLEFGYLALLTLQSMWPDFLSIETLFETMAVKDVSA